jgi:hypothetical protein
MALAATAALIVALPAPAAAGGGHDGMSHSNQPGRPGPLVKKVREVTAPFLNVEAAKAAGYALQFGCVSGPDAGAMGMHFINGALVGDAEIDVNHPEIVIYEPVGNGRVRLIGADFLVFKDAWEAAHGANAAAPQLMGQIFHLFDAPNRFGLPAFYTLHVWAWKDSPSGTFVNWNQNVSCDAFSGEAP